MRPSITVTLHANNVESEDISSEFTMTAKCSRKFCGIIAVAFDRGLWDVRDIHVPIEWRRKGVATKLYEEAAKEACYRGGKLASTARVPLSYSNNFWEKQLIKGRASRKGKTYIIETCPPPALNGSRVRPKRRKGMLR